MPLAATSAGTRLPDSAKRPLFDEGHAALERKHQAAGVAVGGRLIAEPADIAADPIAGILHHQRIDAAPAHGGAHGRPAALHLFGGNTHSMTRVGLAAWYVDVL